MKKKLLYLCTCFCTCLMVMIISSSATAQVTTASIDGLVTDQDGEPLAGTNIIAVHEPSGTQRGVSTRANGRFTKPIIC